MSEFVVLLSVPGLRASDLAHMPNLAALTAHGDRAPLVASFPALTCPVQVNMTTGLPPKEHGVVANGIFWRDTQRVEMWTCGNHVVKRPQLWERLHEHDATITSAAWFPLFIKKAYADLICTPAPIHNPDGSESLWCYTKPEELYGELRDALGHFPLMNFWGPLAGIKSTAWIVSSALWTAERRRPNFWYIYLPHLDYAAQKFGPDSPQAIAACAELDAELGRLSAGFTATYAEHKLLWLVASEYAITPVERVSYPNRVLREAGLLGVKVDDDGREELDFTTSAAWALADHQLAQIFVRDNDKRVIAQVVDLFSREPCVAEVLDRAGQAKYEIDHYRNADVVLASTPDSWFAYYWWNDDTQAPIYARTVDIHRKPGYDSVELFFDPATKGIPLDATLVRGSHGAPPREESQRGVLLCNQRGVFIERTMADVDVAEIVLRQFGV